MGDAEVDEAQKDRIKALFRQFDKDDNGILTKNEVQRLFTLLKGTPVSRSEIDKVFDDIDENGNDQVEIDEFIEWVLCPYSDIRVGNEGPAEYFDLTAALRPLFQVYDRDGNGTVTRDEFSALYDILKGSISIEAPVTPSQTRSSGPKVASELGLSANANRAFDQADDDHDRVLDFEEFVDWVKEAVEHSAISKERFVALTTKLADLLQTLLVVAHCPTCQRAHKKDKSKTQLSNKLEQDLRSQVKNVCEELFEGDPDEGESDAALGSYAWQDFPKNISKHNLLVAHMREEPVPTDEVEHIQMEVAPCFPDLSEKQRRLGAHKSRWLGKVERTVERGHSKGKKRRHTTAASKISKESKGYYYSYEEDSHGHLKWQHLFNPSEYETAYRSLDREFIILAVMITESNFSEELSWGQVQLGFKKAMDLGLVAAEQIEAFSGVVNELCKTRASKGYRDFESLSEDWQSQLVENELQSGSFRPFEVMGLLAQAGIVPQNPIFRVPKMPDDA